MDSPLAGQRNSAEFLKREDGAGTVFSLFVLVALIAIGGLAVDVSNVITSRTELQITADAVAHAALLSRETKSSADAKTVALAMSDANLPIVNVGQVIKAEHIVFGSWNETTRVFTPSPESRSAVRVTAWQHSDADNPIATMMLKVVGFDEWDVSVSSTFMTYHPSCLREGFVAEGRVDLQSNNSYVNGFCIHSNDHVSLNSNNYFEPGTVVSMSDLDDLDLPSSGYKTNIGLREALREGSWNIRILQRIDDIISGIKDANSPFYPKYLTTPTIIDLIGVAGNKKNAKDTEIKNLTIEQVNVKAGRIHRVTCTKASENLTIGKGVKFDSAVIWTNCPITFSEGVIVTNAVIVTTNTSATSMKAPAGMQLGKDDHCAPGGEAQLVSMGSMNFASKLSVFGSQLIAKNDIEFSANANGIEGTQMVAGGEISGTSNMTMGFCGNMENANFQANYFRMVN